MSFRYEKNESGTDLVFEGWEKAIATSPYKGIPNIQAANISTETGEIMVNVSRAQQNQVNGSGTFAFSTSANLQVNSGPNVVAGSWITVSASTHTGELANGNYFVVKNPTSNTFQLSLHFDPTGASVITGYTTGLTASFVVYKPMSSPIARATEIYNTGSAVAYRYYILDNAGYVWAFDSSLNTTYGLTWFLADTNTVPVSNVTGMNVLNGWLFAFGGAKIYCKPTVNLGDTTSNTTTWIAFGPITNSQPTSPNPHYAFVGSQGRLYFTDGKFVGSIFPDTTNITGTANVNIQSYASYTAVTTTGTYTAIISGSVPELSGDTSTRIPAVFFTSPGGTLPTAIMAGTVYYLLATGSANTTFEVYAAASGGSAIDIQTGAIGTQYYNTFYAPNITLNTYTYTSQRLNLPSYETAISLGEVGNMILVGTKSNIVYPWNQVDVTPSGIINVPENNVVNILTVNNMGYLFAGNKGNIYVTNGSTAALVTSIPDYCAGIPGNPKSYIEPYFIWGDSIYLRGRVYFSVLDQTALKTGNCGGIWSFIPTQNFYIGQDTGLALRQENQSSYGTYNGVSTVLIPNQNQTGLFPQYWSSWYSSITSPVYGIDYTGTTTGTVAIFETDLVEFGTQLEKMTPNWIGYKLSSPLKGVEAVSVAYRTNSTDEYVSCGILRFDGTTTVGTLSGYYDANFQNAQWLQFQITLTPIVGTVGVSDMSYIRFKELRVKTI